MSKIINAVKVFFSNLFTKEFVTSLFTPKQEDGFLFYWGFLLYIFINVFAPVFLTLVIVAILVLIYQLIMFGYKDRAFLLRDFIFAFLPAFYMAIAHWLS